MKRKGLIWAGGTLMMASLFLFLVGVPRQVQAGQQHEQANITRGAMLYDKWFAVLGAEAPAGDMPLWQTRTFSNSRSGPDTWRCVSCHGWDYQGKDGAYRAGSNYTGFPGVAAAAKTLSEQDMVGVLKGKKDPMHDFSKYLDDASLNDLVGFLKNELINDADFIDPVSLSVKDGDAAHGQGLYDQQCASCHGTDGATLKFRFEGRDASLGTLAVIDPWRFLHKTRFGTPGTPMVIGYDLKWTPQDGRDVLLYAQSLPSGLNKPAAPPSMDSREGTPVPQVGSPANNLFTGILTAFGAMITSLGFAVLLGVFLIGVIFLLVWLFRDRKK